MLRNRHQYWCMSGHYWPVGDVLSLCSVSQCYDTQFIDWAKLFFPRKNHLKKSSCRWRRVTSGWVNNGQATPADRFRSSHPIPHTSGQKQDILSGQAKNLRRSVRARDLPYDSQNCHEAKQTFVFNINSWTSRQQPKIALDSAFSNRQPNSLAY